MGCCLVVASPVHYIFHVPLKFIQITNEKLFSSVLLNYFHIYHKDINVSTLKVNILEQKWAFEPENSKSTSADEISQIKLESHGLISQLSLAFTLHSRSPGMIYLG